MSASLTVIFSFSASSMQACLETPRRMSWGLGVRTSPFAGDEDVVSGAFGDEAVFVGEQGVGARFHLLRLKLGELIVDPAAVLRFGIDVARGYGLLGRDDEMRPVFVGVRPAANVPHERDDVDGDDRTQAFPDKRVVQGKGAPRDVVHDLVVQAFQRGQIPFNGLAVAASISSMLSPQSICAYFIEA